MNKKQFYADFAKWAGIEGEVHYVSEYVEKAYGCPTCGSDYEFTMYVGYTDLNGSSQTKIIYGRLSDFIGSLDD